MVGIFARALIQQLVSTAELWRLLPRQFAYQIDGKSSETQDIGNGPGRTQLASTRLFDTARSAVDFTRSAAVGSTMDRVGTFLFDKALLGDVRSADAVANNEPIEARAGKVLAIGAIGGPGLRTYLAVRGGFDVPEYLGSRATFLLGGFGGHATGALKAGNVLHLGDAAAGAPHALAREEAPPLPRNWRISVVYGPHGGPDFFLDKDIATRFSAESARSQGSTGPGRRCADDRRIDEDGDCDPVDFKRHRSRDIGVPRSNRQ